LGTLFALVANEISGDLATAPALVSPVPLVHDAPANEVIRERAECLSSLGVDRWHALGFRGQGCKIAILDSGFRNYHDFLGKGLPDQVLAKSFRKDGNFEARESQHGILCAEVIHSIAPDAQLLMVNWEPDDPNSFLEAVCWAKEMGAGILSCSLIMPNWSDGEGGGQVHEALSQLLGAGQGSRDMLFFASAGNTALRHWSGAFNPNEQGFQQWGKGRTLNLLRPWGPDRIAVEVYGPTKNPCELQVLEETSGTLVGKMSFQANITEYWGQAVVRFDPQPGMNYMVRLLCPKKDKDTFHLVALGGNLEDYAPGGSIPFPGDGTNVIAVGAVDRACKRLNYSSCGPNSNSPKPDFVSMVPFPSFFRERPFAGTSAAAPQAAGLAALCWSRYPQWLPQQIRSALQNAALDLSAPGHDWETGYGLVRLP